MNTNATQQSAGFHFN